MNASIYGAKPPRIKETVWLKVVPMASPNEEGFYVASPDYRWHVAGQSFEDQAKEFYRAGMVPPDCVIVKIESENPYGKG